jgi:raffinose/stachyose/melibiose transport system permease protein
MVKKKIKIQEFIISLCLILLGITFLYPMIWILLTSLKSASEVYSNPFGLPEKWLFSNYRNSIEILGLSRYIFNSFIYTIGTVLFAIGTGSLFAYAAARMKWKWSNWGLTFFQTGLIIPIYIIIISLYILMKDTGLKNTYQGLILVYSASALPITVLIFYGFFRSLPNELEESAFLDGANLLQTLWKIILPLSVPAIITTSIVVFMNYSWNEFPIAFITIDEQYMRSLPIAMTYFQTLRGTEWGLLGATMVISSLPPILLYLVASERIEKALTTAAVSK